MAGALYRQLRRRRSGRFRGDSLIEDGVDVSASRIVPGATNQFAIVLVDARSGAADGALGPPSGLTMDPAAVPREAVIRAAVC